MKKVKKAVYLHRPGTALLRPKSYLPRFGVSRAEYDRRIIEGEAPPPVQVGPKSIGLPDYVVEDYVQHLIESEEKFDAERYLKKVGGRVVNA